VNVSVIVSMCVVRLIAHIYVPDGVSFDVRNSVGDEDTKSVQMSVL